MPLMMTTREQRIRLKLKNDFKYYARKCLKIRTKSGLVEPFVLNKAQRYIHAKLEEQRKDVGKIRAIILKGRQQGCSTYVEGRFFWRVTHSRGIRAFILTHDQSATNNLFEMAQRYYKYCPDLIKPQTDVSNVKELYFGLLDSGYKVGTAGNKAVGRSATIQLFHGSEVAFWVNASEHAKGIMQTIPDQENTEIFLESTANGLGNYFHEQWQLAEAGKTDYVPIFIPWYWQEEYKKKVPADFNVTDEEEKLKKFYHLTDEQLVWRRSKMAELSINGVDGIKAFMQEYPCDASEAFQTTGIDSFIPSELVLSARRAVAKEYGPLIVGVDPARFGPDRTSIIRRRGRLAYKLESYKQKDTMEVAGLVHKIIKEEKPARVFVDVGGLGAGVIDRLREMGYGDIVKPVNGGEKPLDPERYVNKRAEMWGEMKLWLQDTPCQIPDNDALHTDLCAPSYKFDSNTRLVLEKKDDMKKRGMLSPDEGDALALTFAFPVSEASGKKINYPDLGIV